MKPRLLDLFCGAGGAAVGYSRAGFEVIGVDIKPQPNYQFEFYQADALDLMRGLLDGVWVWTNRDGWDLPTFAAIHASPPCQPFSRSVKKLNRPKHPDLLAPTRALLIASGLPYVIENVTRAPLIDPIRLCGSAFGLPIQRHRLFESNVALLSNGCAHAAYPRKYPPAWNRTTLLRVLSISGGYQKRQLGEDFMAQHKAAMGIDWDVEYDELSQAIPPAFTEHIGRQLILSLDVRPRPPGPPNRPAVPIRWVA